MNHDHQQEVYSSDFALMLFDVGKHRLAMDAHCVEEVAERRPTTPVPRAPVYILGLLNIRGTPLPLLSLQSFLQLDDQSSQQSPETFDAELGERVLLVTADGYRVALLCHRVRGVVQPDAQSMVSRELTGGGRLREFTRSELESDSGITAVLDIAALLASAQLKA